MAGVWPFGEAVVVCPSGRKSSDRWSFDRPPPCSIAPGVVMVASQVSLLVFLCRSECVVQPILVLDTLMAVRSVVTVGVRL